MKKILLPLLLAVLSLSPAQANVIFPPGSSSGGTGIIPVTTIAASGTSRAIAFPSIGSATYDITLTANCALTFSGGTAGQLQTLTLILRQDATAGRVASLPVGIKWPGGTAPTPNTSAGGIDVYSISTSDGGTTLIGSY